MRWAQQGKPRLRAKVTLTSAKHDLDAAVAMVCPLPVQGRWASRALLRLARPSCPSVVGAPPTRSLSSTLVS